jgi:hypothetical protein
MRNWTTRVVTTLVLIATISCGLPHAGEAATSVTVTLARTTALNTSLDAAGSWIFDGGTVSVGAVVVGRYARVLRTVLGGGTDVQNAAMVTMTIFLLGQATPENLTLQGAHSFTTNDAKGSISAASSSLTGAVGIQWTLAGATNTLTFVVP